MLNVVTQTIDKSLVNQFSFSSKDVLQASASRSKRQYDLLRALKLGNLNKQHVEICFVDSKGNNMKTRATIWAVTKKYVVLKASNMIPISSITCVEL